MTAWPDACAAAGLVRTGQASPLELVEEAIARIERTDPQVSALVRERFDAARAEAAGKLPDGPFRGVPLLLKDLGCHLAGDATHYGTGFLRAADWRSSADSALGQAFRRAGFVVLGRTRVPELGTTVTTESAAYGPTRNPYDLQRSSGGSSGGSAVAMATGMVAVAHGGDGGGSIRIPAALCGLVGLKPSRGRVSQGPQVGEAWGGATVDGALTRTVRDSAAVLDAIAGPTTGDPYWAQPPVRPFAQEVGAEPGRLRVGLLPAPPQEGVEPDPDGRAAVEATGQLLERLGHSVELAAPAALGEPEFGRHFNRVIGADVALTVEQFGQALGRKIADDELEPRNQAYRRLGQSLGAPGYLASRHWLAGFTRRVRGWWREFDVLVTPTVNGPAPRLGELDAGGDTAAARERVRRFMTYTAQINVTGQPALSLPLHVGRHGLPVGVQLVAEHSREDVLFRLAAQLESAAPWSHRHPALA